MKVVYVIVVGGYCSHALVIVKELSKRMGVIVKVFLQLGVLLKPNARALHNFCCSHVIISVTTSAHDIKMLP